MSNVLPFPIVTPDMRVGSVSVTKDVRRTRREYLDLAKVVLPKDDYEKVLMSIMDAEYYTKSDRLIREAVDDYYDLPKSREEW
jgi:hypothetical protein